MITSLNLHIEEGDEPSGDISSSIAILHLNGQGVRGPRIISNPTTTAAAYLRRLATEADKLADAIDARLAESTAGEARDVPTPGAAT